MIRLEEESINCEFDFLVEDCLMSQFSKLQIRQSCYYDIKMMSTKLLREVYLEGFFESNFVNRLT